MLRHISRTAKETGGVWQGHLLSYTKMLIKLKNAIELLLVHAFLAYDRHVEFSETSQSGSYSVGQIVIFLKLQQILQKTLHEKRMK